MRDLRDYIVDKDTVYRYYKWKPEDGDYKPSVSIKANKIEKSIIGRFINLLVSVFVLGEVHNSRR